MRLRVFIVVAVIASSGCATVNESFSCNKTAGDSCLTMDEVNAMTEEKGVYVRKPVFKSTIQAHVDSKGRESLWIAGQDNQGARHA
jgi:conjugal transfer pilus assembly protein TraV